MALYIAGGETALTSGLPTPPLMARKCKAFTPPTFLPYMMPSPEDVTDTIVQNSSRSQATPMEVFIAEAAPDDVP